MKLYTILNTKEDVKEYSKYHNEKFNYAPLKSYLNDKYELPTVLNIEKDGEICGHQGAYEDDNGNYIYFEEVLEEVKNKKFIPFQAILNPEDYPEYFI